MVTTYQVEDLPSALREMAESIGLDEIARTAGVTQRTVRNWLKQLSQGNVS